MPKRVFILGIIILAINFALDTYYKNNSLYNSRLQRKDRQFQKQNEAIKFLFLGDSHTERAVDTRIIPESFNYSSSGENYFQTYYKLKKILKKQKPKFVVLPIEIHTFSSFFTNQINDDSYWVNYINYFELAKQKVDFQFICKYFKGKYYSYVGEFENIYYQFATRNEKPIEIYKGYVPDYRVYKPKPKNETERESRVEFHLKNKNHFDKDLTLYFEKVLDLCEKNNIKIILIKYPISVEYYNESKRYLNFRKRERNLKKITKSYENIILELDYQKLYLKENNYFRDADHLNNIGAEKFSKILYEELSSY